MKLFTKYTENSNCFWRSNCLTHGRRKSGTLRVQGADSKTRRYTEGGWRPGEGIRRFHWQYDAMIKTLSGCFFIYVRVCSLAYFDIETNIPPKIRHKITPVFFYHEKGALSQNIVGAECIIFRFEVDLSLGVQCRNIYISALTCLEKKTWKQKNHAPRNKKQVSYLCIALRCKDNCSWFFKKINKISIWLSAQSASFLSLSYAVSVVLT